MQRSSSLAPSARATRHGHARACRPSHAAAREFFGNMRRSPGGEELDDHEAVWIWWQQTRHPSRAHGLRHGRWGPRRMGCSAAHLARQAASKDVPCRVATCVTTLLHTFGYVIDNNVCYRITTYVIDIIDVVVIVLQHMLSIL